MDLVETPTRDLVAGPRHPWERARLRLLADLVARHVQLQAADAVLDIGCGDTYVVEQLARLYPQARFFAVDSAFSEAGIATYRARLGVGNVSLFRALDDVPLATPAALVLLMDVIEHVPDDAGFLREICSRPLVGDRTCFVVTVPSYQSLFCAHDRYLGHYRRYSSRSLRQLLASVDLRAVEEGHFFVSLLPPRLLQVIRERMSGGKEIAFKGLASWGAGETAARLTTSLLTFDGRASLWLARAGVDLPGLSTFAVCRTSA